MLSETFWVVPAAITLAGIILALALVQVDARELLPEWLRQGGWLYNGGATGARTLLATVASSTIGVASTVFSITIAALSLAAGQMGPVCFAISRKTAATSSRLVFFSAHLAMH